MRFYRAWIFVLLALFSLSAFACIGTRFHRAWAFDSGSQENMAVQLYNNHASLPLDVEEIEVESAAVDPMVIILVSRPLEYSLTTAGMGNDRGVSLMNVGSVRGVLQIERHLTALVEGTQIKNFVVPAVGRRVFKLPGPLAPGFGLTVRMDSKPGTIRRIGWTWCES